MKRFHSRSLIAIGTVLCLLFGFCGCTDSHVPADASVSDTTTDATAGALLKLSATKDPDSGYTHIPNDRCGGYFRSGLTYMYVTDVSIEIGGEAMKLEDALQEGSIYPEEIFCLARMDARNGFCEEVYESSNGLTHFSYHYPDFSLRLIYDVYETPDSEQHLICDLCVYITDLGNAGFVLSPYTKFPSEEQVGYLDYEDWGITLESEEASGNGITIHCTQTAGQQIGQLQISWYELAKADGFVEKLDGSKESPSYVLPLNMNGDTSFTIDWTETFGALPSGTYQLILYIEDIYEDAEVHPLLKNYHDLQLYEMWFTVP